MSFRIVFWPYDHQFLAEVAGANDASLINEIDRLAADRIQHDAGGGERIRRAQLLAESVMAGGFPPRFNEREEDHHRLAVDFLVQSCVVRRTLPSTDFRYLDLLDSFQPDFFTPFPELEVALSIGRPWFGSACPDEETYGTMDRDEVRRFTERCVEFRPRYTNPQWEIDPLIDVFRSAVHFNCELWFGI